MNCADRFRIEQRFSAKRHNGSDIILFSNVLDCFSRNIFIDVFTGPLMITLGTMLTFACASKCDDKLYAV